METKAIEDSLCSSWVGSKHSIEEPPELELKTLPNHLEYAPVIIASNLDSIQKDKLLKMLKRHKRAIVWKIVDIIGINLLFCTHKILMEDEIKLKVQLQRRLSPNMNEIVKTEVKKL